MENCVYDVSTSTRPIVPPSAGATIGAIGGSPITNNNFEAVEIYLPAYGSNIALVGSVTITIGPSSTTPNIQIYNDTVPPG